MKNPRYKLLEKWENKRIRLEELEKKQANTLAKTQLKISEINEKIKEEYKRANIIF